MLLTTRHGRGLALAIALSSVSAELTAQLTRSDYERAARLRERYEYATLGVAETPSFIGKSRRFQYRRSVSGGHEFVVVDADSLDDRKARITHKNLNDNTVEGLELLQAPCFTVQYHPEAAPGPRDAQYLFERFRALIEKNRALVAR